MRYLKSKWKPLGPVAKAIWQQAGISWKGWLKEALGGTTGHFQSVPVMFTLVKSQLHRPTVSSRPTTEIWHPEIKVVYIAMLMQLFHVSKIHRGSKMSFQIKILLSLDDNRGGKPLRSSRTKNSSLLFKNALKLLPRDQLNHFLSKSEISTNVEGWHCTSHSLSNQVSTLSLKGPSWGGKREERKRKNLSLFCSSKQSFYFMQKKSDIEVPLST